MDVEGLIQEAGAGRRSLKRLGARLDAEPDLLAAVVRHAGLPEEALGWPGKRVLRRALGREDEARRRGNPIRRDEPFACADCGFENPPGGAQVRDHCSRCLASLHVDVVPGDRAAGCGGVLEAIGLERRGDDWVIAYRCRACGHRHRCRAHPDDTDALVALSRSFGVGNDPS